MKSVQSILMAMFIFATSSQSAHADYISGNMTLRDAIYLYNIDTDGNGSISFYGINCDIFQIVLDLDTGYTDLVFSEGNDSTEIVNNVSIYSNRIKAQHKMFSYSLYQNKTIKTFGFADIDTFSQENIGKGTFFAYCFSTKTNSYVFQYDGNNCIRKYSDGSTEAAGCF